MSSGSSVRKGSKKGQAGGQRRPRVEEGPDEGAPVGGVPAEPLTAIPEVEEAVGLPEAAGSPEAEGASETAGEAMGETVRETVVEAAAAVPEESAVVPVVEAVADESAVVPVVEAVADESAPDQESHELEDEFPVSPVNYDEPGLFETWRDEGLYRFDAGKQGTALCLSLRTEGSWRWRYLGELRWDGRDLRSRSMERRLLEVLSKELRRFCEEAAE